MTILTQSVGYQRSDFNLIILAFSNTDWSSDPTGTVSPHLASSCSGRLTFDLPVLFYKSQSQSPAADYSSSFKLAFPFPRIPGAVLCEQRGNLRRERGGTDPAGGGRGQTARCHGEEAGGQQRHRWDRSCTEVDLDDDWLEWGGEQMDWPIRRKCVTQSIRQQTLRLC